MGNMQGGGPLGKRDKSGGNVGSGGNDPQASALPGPGPLKGIGRNLRSSSDDDPIGLAEGLQMKLAMRRNESARSPRIVTFDDVDEYPVVIKYTGNAKAVQVAGTWDGWKKKIPLVKSTEDFTTILNLPEGRHEFRFFVDGRSICDHSLPRTEGSPVENNLIMVDKADFEVFDALEKDSRAAAAARYSTKSKDRDSSDSESANEGGGGAGPDSLTAGGGPKGGGGDQASTNQQSMSMGSLEAKPFGQWIPDRRHFEKSTPPPALPPHLLQVVLNKETPVSCDPNTLPEPNHVMLNHLYALSIKDDVMVLSATHRYRKKYVTTLLYKPV